MHKNQQSDGKSITEHKVMKMKKLYNDLNVFSVFSHMCEFVEFFKNWNDKFPFPLMSKYIEEKGFRVVKIEALRFKTRPIVSLHDFFRKVVHDRKYR